LNPNNTQLTSIFKAQLLEYVDEKEEPFDTKFLVTHCNSFIDDEWVRNALWELEEEGKIVRLNHHYLSTRTMMRRWIISPQKPQPTPREDFNGFILPRSLIREIQEALIERRELGYLDIGEFIRDALRRRIEQLENNDSK
jgi:hypothetical protein